METNEREDRPGSSIKGRFADEKKERLEDLLDKQSLILARVAIIADLMAKADSGPENVGEIGYLIRDFMKEANELNSKVHLGLSRKSIEKET